MEKQNFNFNVKYLITDLLDNNLNSKNYDKIINILNNVDDNNIIVPLVMTLNLIDSESKFLKLKLKESILHYLNNFLYTPTFLIPQEDGLIYFDENNYPTTYYEINDELKEIIRFKNIKIEKDNIGIYKEKIYYYNNNSPWYCKRIFKINSEGKILSIVSELKQQLYEPNFKENQIYTGILADILEGTNQNIEQYVTAENL